MDDERLDRLLRELRIRGASPIEAIALIVRESGVSLAEAKARFAADLAWVDVHEAAQPLHDAAEKLADKQARAA